MQLKGLAVVAALTALTAGGCATAPDLTPTRKVAKRDMAACSQLADRAVNDPTRKNQQTAVVVGSTIGAGLIGLVVSAAATSADDNAMATKTRDRCLSSRGYKMVPKKTKD